MNGFANIAPVRASGAPIGSASKWTHEDIQTYVSYAQALRAEAMQVFFSRLRRTVVGFCRGSRTAVVLSRPSPAGGE